MSTITEVLHRIRVKLYPNYLPGVPGAYIARTDDEASLTIEDVCAALKTRGGYTGSYDDLVEHVHLFYGEVGCQLCGGFSVNTGLYSIHPKVGGTFDSGAAGQHSLDGHPVSFAFRVRQPLRNLAQNIGLFIEGVADTSGYIDRIVDVTTQAENEVLTPNGPVTIFGHRIRIGGEDPSVGLYFAPAAGGDAVKFTGNFIDNTSGKIAAITPALAAGQWRVRIVTQIGGGSRLLKEPRTVEFAQELTVN